MLWKKWSEFDWNALVYAFQEGKAKGLHDTEIANNLSKAINRTPGAILKKIYSPKGKELLGKFRGNTLRDRIKNVISIDRNPITRTTGGSNPLFATNDQSYEVVGGDIRDLALKFRQMMITIRELQQENAALKRQLGVAIAG